MTGRNLRIVPPWLIVQSWRGGVWRSDDVDSILILCFEPTSRGACVQMVHAALPPRFKERWDELYWEPLRRGLRMANV